MKKAKSVQLVGVLCAAGALSACNTNAQSGAGGSQASTPALSVATSGMANVAATSNSFLSAFNAANVQLATATPMSGTANYKGQVEVHTTAIRTDPDNVVFGDVDMSVNFDGAASPVTATVTNFAGRIGGVDTTVGGTLSSVGSGGINTVLALPVAGTTATSIAVQVEGALNDPTSTLTGNARMAITGQARGANATSLVGANSTVITDSSGTNKIATGGRFYANR